MSRLWDQVEKRSATMVTRIALVALGLLAFATSASGEEPKGFLDAPWGTPLETVTKKLPPKVQCRRIATDKTAVYCKH